MRTLRPFNHLASRIALGLLLASVVVAHGENDNHGGDDQVEADDSEYPPTYFSHPQHAAILYAHIAVMTFAWVAALPVAVMLSLAKSRFTLVTQFSFLALNATGIIFGTIYNAKTPDLYPNNAHHKIGWVASFVISAQVVVSLLQSIARAIKGTGKGNSEEEYAFLPGSIREVNTSRFFSDGYRLSNDSGQGSEPNTESIRSNSLSLAEDAGRQSLPAFDKTFVDEPIFPPTSSSRVAAWFEKLISSRVWQFVEMSYNIVDRLILPLGFIVLVTGIVTLGRFFEGHAIFNGLAHWIKGGIFFWLGLFCLGRWSGSFAELGWAWNLRAKTRSAQRWRPTAEFVESALIFFYGSTNIFLEHLSSTDGTWTPTDLEHLSITVLFLGGGLCGMLVESTTIRDLLNTTATNLLLEHTHSEEGQQARHAPATYEFSMNPIPALVILLLGIMMGGHHQDSMISTMVHKQWGNLLLGASCARCLTYLLVFLRPPSSVHPSRPPTELLSSFGLMAGGIIFMASSSDVISGMIHYDMDAMSVYTVTLGLVGLLMAWELAVLAIKGWATRQEQQIAHLNGFA